MLSKFIRLVFSDVKFSARLLHPRRIRNALRFFFSNSGNLSQLYQRYADMYRANDSAIDSRIIAALEGSSTANCIFIFPIVDWRFRFQRPQHIATQLGKLGFKVFYFFTTPMAQQGGRYYQFTDMPADNVFLCRLQASDGLNDDLHRSQMSALTRESYLLSLQMLLRDLEIVRPAVILQHHYWAPLVRQLPTGLVGYDCMDHHLAFHDPSGLGIPAQEEQLIRDSDFVVVSSIYLQDKVAPLRTSTLIRNGCDSALFSAIARKKVDNRRPVAGYIGAIAEWFDIRLLADVAKLLPEWHFVLVGSYVGCDIGAIAELKNIELVGEVEYAEVPTHLARFDVCMIPFKLTELTKATNPVKIYEYFSAGKPVVSTPLPEVLIMGDIVLIGDTPADFAAQLQEGLRRSADDSYAESVKHWATAHDWSLRGQQFAALLAPT